MPLDTGPRLKQTGYYLNKVKEFLADNHNKILVLHAPGGSGKSHLLRQIAFDLEERHPEYIILSVTPGYPNLESASRASWMATDDISCYLTMQTDGIRSSLHSLRM